MKDRVLDYINAHHNKTKRPVCYYEIYHDFSLLCLCMEFSFIYRINNILASNDTVTCFIISDGIVITQAPAHNNVKVNRTAFMFCQAAFGFNYDLTYVWKFNGKEIDYNLSPEYISVS